MAMQRSLSRIRIGTREIPIDARPGEQLGFTERGLTERYGREAHYGRTNGEYARRG